MTPEERSAALEAIAAEVRVCQRCRLAQQRTRAVPGEGNPDTEVVFVGEGPGFNEDQQGRPFVGAAGSFLDELIGSVGWRRSDVFITNVVKCRPPGNRDPEPDEMAACAPFLRRQLEVLDPALIVTLGRFSLGTFMPGARISQVHGTVRPVDPATGARAARAFAMYHPAAALRQGALKETMRDDMSRVPGALIASRQERATLAPAGGPAPAPPPPMPEAADAEPVAQEPPAPPMADVVTEHAPQAEPAPEAGSPLAAEPALERAPPPADPVGPAPTPDDPTDAAAPADDPSDTVEALATLDGLAPFEVLGVSHERSPETDQMRLF